MDCRKFQKNLEDYLEGGLDFPGRFGMERHARQCFHCEKELAGAQKLGQMARELTRVSAPPNFESALLSRIQVRGERSRFMSLRRFWVYDYPSWRTVAMGTATLAFLSVGILLMFKTQWTGRESQAPDIPLAGSPAQASGSSGANTAYDSARNSMSPAATLEKSDPRPPAPIAIVSPPERGGYSAEDQGFYGQIEPSEYVDYLVPGPGDRPMIVRLPKTIRMKYGQPSEEYFIRHVSH